MTEPHLEVCVVGGGPAGAAAAVRLAHLGHRVGVIERAPFPRSHVGESLTKGLWTLFDILGLREADLRQSFLKTAETLVRWDKEDIEELPSHAGGVLVNRGYFDKFLLKEAEGAGAEVIQPAWARDAVWNGSVWQVEVMYEGRSRWLTADYLVDASGRKPFLPGARTRVSPPTLALCGYLPVAGAPQPVRIEAIPDGWCWGAPVPGNLFSAMVFLSPETVRERQTSGLEELWRLKLAKTELFAWMSALPLIHPIAAYDATAYSAADSTATNFIAIGEASFTLDPLSSTGVEKAIQTGCIAAVALHTMLLRPESKILSMKFCAERRSETVSSHADWAAGFYRRVVRFREFPFWLARSQSSANGEARSIPEPTNQTSELRITTRIQLSRSAHLVKEPCIMGSEICERTALRHPSLGRPVAFVDGVELEPLLAVIPESTTIGALLALWSAEVPGHQARRVAQWLVMNQILEPVF
jgi:flavin-dependent dehydrogenase